MIFCSVTGGTMVVSDEITIVITSNPGESFIDKMISLVEGAARQKTPNEIAFKYSINELNSYFLDRRCDVADFYKLFRFSN